MIETQTSDKNLEKEEQFDLVYDGVNAIGHALMFPARVFQKNVFAGVALIGVIGLIGAGILYTLRLY